MSNQTKEQVLEQRVRDSAPLLERLADIRKRVGHMCSNHHGPKMTIPVAWYDDDFFIATTVKDAIEALNAQPVEPPGRLLMQDRADDLIRELQRQGMETLRIEFAGKVLTVSPMRSPNETKEVPQRLPARPTSERGSPDGHVRCASCDQGLLPDEVFYKPRECCEKGATFDRQQLNTKG